MDNRDLTEENTDNAIDAAAVELPPSYDGGESTEQVIYQKIDNTRPSYVIPAVLFVITFFTTLSAGAMYEGFDIFENLAHLQAGLPFAISLMFILGTHELGHFFAARYHKVNTTLPIFLPAPPIEPFILGTFGAVIKMKSAIRSKEAMVDIGAYGPIAGFIVAIIIVIVGLNQSSVVYLPTSGDFSLGLDISEVTDDGNKHFMILTFGSSILYNGLEYLVKGDLPEGAFVYLSSTAFAGWIGLFVTSLNLIPIGQLDGGHIMYSFFSRHHRKISLTIIVFMIVFGFFTWPGWIVWALMVFFLALKHPKIGSTDNPINHKVDRKRFLVAIISVVILILTFTPSPFNILFYK